MANLKSSCDAMLSSQILYNIYCLGQFFKGLDFTNLSDLQNLQNLSTSKKPTIWYIKSHLYVNDYNKIAVEWFGSHS